MIKKHWKKAIISSVLILFPIVIGLILWNKLPDTMATHWGADGNVDGFGSKAFAVFGLPVILLFFHLLCLLLDKGQKEQSPKVQGIVFWIIPVLSLFLSSITYAVALGKTVDVTLVLPGLFAVMFIFIGNYLPKMKRNRTMGIKIEWTLCNDENWNKTHRLAGKLWVCGGFVILLSILLPAQVMLAVMVAVFLAMLIIPVAYSFVIYRTHKKQGVVYEELPETKTEKLVGKISAVVIPLLLIVLCFIMFTGDVDIALGEDSFQIEARYWTDLEVSYNAIDSIELRSEKVSGNRIYGFGSARLSLGNFENEEFGSYIRYTYTGCDSCIVLNVDGKILIVSGKDDTQTQTWYQLLLNKI